MPKVQWIIGSPVGPIHLEATNMGLCGVYLDEAAIGEPSVNPPSHPLLRKAAEQLADYFSGRRFAFDLPLDVEGTPFQKKVWAALKQIPYGKTRSYQEIAKAIGNPSAARAVGGANGRNPVSVIVPCHRVIASDGGWGGYSGGISIKQKLLQLEQRAVNRASCAVLVD